MLFKFCEYIIIFYNKIKIKTFTMKSKNIKLFVLLVFYFNIIQAQQIQVLFYDNANYVDTITIGYMPNATLGIDTLLGKRNLSS